MSEETVLPAINTRPIEVKTMASVPFIIKHELGRVPAGWLVIDCNRLVNVWRTGVMDTESIELTTDQDAELTLVLL